MNRWTSAWLPALLLAGGLRAQTNNALLQTMVSQAKATVAEAHPPYRTPFSVDHGKKEWMLDSFRNWRSGFWAGTQWYLFEATGDAFWKQEADKSTRILAELLNKSPHSHDVGFQFTCSFGNALRLEKDPAYAKVMLRAADSLATLFDPKYQSICSWPYRVKTLGWPHHVIVDNLMNLELLFWASKNGGSRRLYDIAVAHARTTMKGHFRPDGSTAHVVWFDPATGQPDSMLTHQGYADGSMWARGQGWAIYGFTVAARETGDPIFLQTARRAADTYLKRLPCDHIPYWDFDDPAIPSAPRDASAAAVVASGLLELATLVKEPAVKLRYRNAALAMLDELSSPRYVKPWMNHAMLQHSTGNKPQGKDIDVPIIYADYYYMEAMIRAGRFAKKVK